MGKRQQKFNNLSLLAFSFFQFLSDKELIEYFSNIGSPLPMSLSTIQKDRRDGRLGGVPHRKIGGAVVYTPGEVIAFLTGRPIIQPARLRVNTKPIKHKNKVKLVPKKSKIQSLSKNQLEMFPDSLAGGK